MGPESSSPTPYPTPPRTPAGSCRLRRVVPRHRRERSVDRPLADRQRYGGKTPRAGQLVPVMSLAGTGLERMSITVSKHTIPFTDTVMSISGNDEHPGT